MTVSSTTARVSYSGNGTTTAFTVPFYFLANSQLGVSLYSSAGVETVQLLDTNYTVTGAGVTSGGTVTMTVAPATGTTLVIYRGVPLTQATDLLPNDRLPAESIEQSLDKLTMLTQQLNEGVVRSIRTPIGDSSALDMRLPTVANRLRKVLGFDSTGKPYLFNSVDDLENIIANGNPLASFPVDLGSVADAVIIYRYDLGGL
jgi:hypothetical protein